MNGNVPGPTSPHPSGVGPSLETSKIRICLSDADAETRGAHCSGLAPCEACRAALAIFVLPKAISGVGNVIRETLQAFQLRAFMGGQRSPEEVEEFLGAFETYVNSVPGEPETRAWLEAFARERRVLAERVLGVLPQPSEEGLQEKTNGTVGGNKPKKVSRSKPRTTQEIRETGPETVAKTVNGTLAPSKITTDLENTNVENTKDLTASMPSNGTSAKV